MVDQPNKPGGDFDTSDGTPRKAEDEQAVKNPGEGLPRGLSQEGRRTRVGGRRDVTRRRLVVTGRVQNVFYRDWFVEQAMALGLDGWVRNRAAARVEDVAVSDVAPAGTLAGFAKRATL